PLSSSYSDGAHRDLPSFPHDALPIYQTAYEGARIVVEALNRPGGLQAFRIVSMDESTARHPAQMPAPRTHVVVEPSSSMVRLERSEEHTSELQSRENLVCRLLLEKKK